MVSEKELIELMSFKDCKELKKVILENPDLPLLCFADAEYLGDEFSYYSLCASCVEVKEVTLYNSRCSGGMWLDKDDFEERLQYDMECDEQYDKLTSEEFFAVLKEKVNNTPFVKAIVVYLGD